MKSAKLAQVIRKIVREEVQREVRNALVEQRAKAQSNVSNDSLSLTEALQQTQNEEWPTVRSFNKSDARSAFANMQNITQAPPQTDLNGRLVDVNQLSDDLNSALTRDYSELVKRFNK